MRGQILKGAAALSGIWTAMGANVLAAGEDASQQAAMGGLFVVMGGGLIIILAVVISVVSSVVSSVASAVDDGN